MKKMTSRITAVLCGAVLLGTALPPVQLPLIENVIRHLQGKDICTCTGISATPTNWVMDRILGKI